LNKKIEKIEEVDFGFSFVDEDINEIKKNAERLEIVSTINEASLEKTQQKLNTVLEMFDTFLNNLKKNPDKSTIYWPNRIEKIEEFQKKLKEIVG
jgi:hypothetical protein